MAQHVLRRQAQQHPLRVIHPDLLAMIARAIDCQVAAIRRKLHRQYAIAARQPERIVEAGNDLRRAHRLPIRSLHRARQHKAL